MYLENKYSLVLCSVYCEQISMQFIENVTRYTQPTEKVPKSRYMTSNLLTDRHTEIENRTFLFNQTSQ